MIRCCDDMMLSLYDHTVDVIAHGAPIMCAFGFVHACAWWCIIFVFCCFIFVVGVVLCCCRQYEHRHEKQQYTCVLYVASWWWWWCTVAQGVCSMQLFAQLYASVCVKSKQQLAKSGKKGINTAGQIRKHTSTTTTTSTQSPSCTRALHPSFQALTLL